jgi:hypothetical protein
MRILLALTLASLLASCGGAKYTTRTAKSSDIYGPGVVQKPVIVDLEVKDKKVTGSATSKKGESIESLKALAISNAIKDIGADVLVEPVFEITVQKKFTAVLVSGYPAYYKNFRPITEADVKLLKVGSAHTTQTTTPSLLNLVKRKRKNKGAK